MRELDDALGPFDLASAAPWDTRTCKNTVHRLDGPFCVNEVWLQECRKLANNLATFLHSIDLPKAMADWSLAALEAPRVPPPYCSALNGLTCRFQPDFRASDRLLPTSIRCLCRSERLLAAHIDRPTPVPRIRNELRSRSHFRKGRSNKNVNSLKLKKICKASLRGPRAVG